MASLTDLKNRLAACDLCPRRCGVNRLAGETGFCGNDASPAIYQHFLHFGEEISIVPAFIVNLSGCSLDCPFCSERCHFFTHTLPVKSPEHYARALAGHFRRAMPASLEWIGGEPSVQLPFVLETSAELRRLLHPCPPILLNTNAYFDASLLDAMTGLIDGFVFDLKCSAGCQKAITGVDDYWPTVTAVLRAATRFPGTHYIRHLVVPGHLDCCTRQVLQWCREFVPDMVVNLMTGYFDFRPDTPAPSLSDAEKAEAIRLFEAFPAKRRMIDGKWV